MKTQISLFFWSKVMGRHSVTSNIFVKIAILSERVLSVWKVWTNLHELYMKWKNFAHLFRINKKIEKKLKFRKFCRVLRFRNVPKEIFTFDNHKPQNCISYESVFYADSKNVYKVWNFSKLKKLTRVQEIFFINV